MPTAPVVTQRFEELVKTIAFKKGMPNQRFTFIPHPVAGRAPELCRKYMEGKDPVTGVPIVEELLAALTKPLNNEEKKTGFLARPPRPRLLESDTPSNLTRLFQDSGWTDGLPIVLPTEEKVAEMLKGTSHAPDETVGAMRPSPPHEAWEFTVEMVAANAVMAGALPTHMPVLIAAIESLADPKTRFDTFEVSTGSWAPFFAINGPIRDQIHINYGSGALSPGDIANAAIGRAVGLMVKNIGGARKGIEDMGVIGNPAKYTLVIGENEEESPWEPLHVERGFQKDDNTLTVFFPNSYMQAVPTETSAEGIALAMQNMNPWSMSAFIVIPSHAKILSDAGWTKEKLKEFILKKVESPIGAFLGRDDEDEAAGEDVLSQPPAAVDTDTLLVLVAGGPGAWTGLLRSVGGIENDFVTVKISTSLS